MAHRARFSLSYADPAAAKRVERALRPEVDDIEGDRARAELERHGAEMRIDVEADDLVALRAGLNTWLTLASVAERAGGVAGPMSTESA
jgi:KEOPS complex subunit Pcc1